MAATDGQIVVAAARWADEGSYLREFVQRQRLPAVVKIAKGQYGGLGVPTLPSPALHNTVLLLTVGRRRKLLAQAVKIKEGRRLVGVGPRLAIPDTYAGWFELLSEEGRAARCIESVAELARRRPDGGCLVREPVRASTPGGSTRTVAAGELLVAIGEAVTDGAHLHCLDARGDALLLPLEARAKFSPVAREDNISGVHTARNLLHKRLPCTVRLVHGSRPVGLKAPHRFLPELRLLHAIEEEHVFALPLHKEATHVTPLPLSAPLKLLRTRNDEQLRAMAEFERLVDKAVRFVADVADRMHVLDGKLGDSKQLPLERVVPVPPPPGPYMLRRSASSDSANQRQRHHHHHHHRRQLHQRDENRSPSHAAAVAEYDEIDQIYDYVRGFAPLPRTVRAPFSEPSPPGSASEPAPTGRPEPPPIDTIPTKKLHAEKRNRKTIVEPMPVVVSAVPVVVNSNSNNVTALPKLYVKNSQSQRSRLLRQKSASPLKEAPPTSPLPKNGSPLFNIRYKSLSNLQQAMELDGGGTLDSSRSGGGDSGGGTKQPEKRSRRLSRPRSLTNLVWEPRELPPPPPPPPLARSSDPPPPPPLPPHRRSKHVTAPKRGGGTLYL